VTCAHCGRKLKPDHYVLSSWEWVEGRWRYRERARTRYCWPGEGCWKNEGRRKAPLTVSD
jgi:hypothetical protein